MFTSSHATGLSHKVRRLAFTGQLACRLIESGDCQMPRAENQKFIHPNNLKSFQRISAQDMRYLKELGDAAARQREMSSPSKVSINHKLRRALDFHIQTIRRLMDKMLYENVPADHTLMSEQEED